MMYDVCLKHPSAVRAHNDCVLVHRIFAAVLAVERTFHVRMRCVLAKRNAGLTEQGYKVSAHIVVTRTL